MTDTTTGSRRKRRIVEAPLLTGTEGRAEEADPGLAQKSPHPEEPPIPEEDAGGRDRLPVRVEKGEVSLPSGQDGEEDPPPDELHPEMEGLLLPNLSAGAMEVLENCLDRERAAERMEECRLIARGSLRAERSIAASEELMKWREVYEEAEHRWIDMKVEAAGELNDSLSATVAEMFEERRQLLCRYGEELERVCELEEALYRRSPIRRIKRALSALGELFSRRKNPDTEMQKSIEGGEQ